MFTISLNSAPVLAPTNVAQPCPEPQQPPVEVKEDFGRLVRRIMYSNSGQFRSLNATSQQVESKDWTRYEELAEAAAQSGNYTQAESMWLHALEEAKNFFHGDTRLVSTLENLASLYFSMRRYEQAEMFCQRAIEAAKAAFGPTHLRVANCMNNLAGIYYNQRRFDEAEPLCIKLLYMYEGIYGPDHADVGMALNNLAMLYHAQQKYKQAEKMYQRALRIRSKALGNDDPSVALLLRNFCNLLYATDRTTEALELSNAISAIESPYRQLKVG